MEKIKRNMKIEKNIKLTKAMYLWDFLPTRAKLDDWIRIYKESKWKDRTFRDKDVDMIIETLENLPGYSPERFIETGEVFAFTKLGDEKAFDFLLQIAYIYLSMMNPDLFEGEAFDGRIDIND